VYPLSELLTLKLFNVFIESLTSDAMLPTDIFLEPPVGLDPITKSAGCAADDGKLVILAIYFFLFYASLQNLIQLKLHNN